VISFVVVVVCNADFFNMAREIWNDDARSLQELLHRHRRRGFLQTEGLPDLLGSRACSLSVAVQGTRLSRVNCAR
jgi:hypothetical protein